MDNLTKTERIYQAAKARLQTAQQEKLEAATEFLAARSALRQTLEGLWPSPCECGGKPALMEEAEMQQALIPMR